MSAIPTRLLTKAKTMSLLASYSSQAVKKYLISMMMVKFIWVKRDQNNKNPHEQSCSKTVILIGKNISNSFRKKYLEVLVFFVKLGIMLMSKF